MIKYAFLNFWKDKCKNLFLGIILTVHFFLLVNIDLIHTSIKTMIANYESQLSHQVRLVSNYVPNKFIQQLTEEQYLKYEDSRFIEKMELSGMLPIFLEDLKTTNLEWSVTQFTEGNVDVVADLNGKQTMVSAILKASRREVSSSKSSAENLLKGTNKLALNECLVGETFAKLNHLNVGSKMTISLSTNDANNKVELTVAGIEKEYLSAPKNEASIYKQEEITTNFDTFRLIQQHSENPTFNAVYFLKNRKNLDLFEKELKNKGLPENYQVVSDKEVAAQIMSPFNNKEEIVRTLLISVFIFDTVVLLFFSTIFTKKRQKESYTLMSFGFKKRQIAFSLWLEKTLLLSVCLFLAFLLSIAFITVLNQNFNNWITQVAIDSSYFFEEYNRVLNVITIKLDSNVVQTAMISAGIILTTLTLSDSYQIWRFNPVIFLLEGSTDG